MKKFIFEDFEKLYEAGATHFKKSPGKPPVMHFLDEDGNSKKTLDISGKTREELRAIMEEHGFKMKEGDKEEEKEEGTPQGHDEV